MTFKMLILCGLLPLAASGAEFPAGISAAENSAVRIPEAIGLELRPYFQQEPRLLDSGAYLFEHIVLATGSAVVEKNAVELAGRVAEANARLHLQKFLDGFHMEDSQIVRERAAADKDRVKVRTVSVREAVVRVAGCRKNVCVFARWRSEDGLMARCTVGIVYGRLPGRENFRLLTGGTEADKNLLAGYLAGDVPRVRLISDRLGNCYAVVPADVGMLNNAAAELRVARSLAGKALVEYQNGFTVDSKELEVEIVSGDLSENGTDLNAHYESAHCLRMLSGGVASLDFIMKKTLGNGKARYLFLAPLNE